MAKKTADRLIPPANGVVVRMYRIGHGDCFLLAFPGKKADDPKYVLIDCGYKPGSPAFINTTPKEVTDNLRVATGGHIDVAIITHEHQDHVNAITKTHFKDFTIGEAWFAWTEDPDDAVANELRKNFKDKLLGLLAARNNLAAAGDTRAAEKIDSFLAFEFGGDQEQFNAAGAAAVFAAGLNSDNKQSMKIFKDRASKGVKFIRPHQKILKLPGVDNVRVFALGPPRDEALLKSLDPIGEEGFHLGVSRSASAYFGAAARALADGIDPQAPFDSQYSVPFNHIKDLEGETGQFFRVGYGVDGDQPVTEPTRGADEIESNAAWRRIDRDWLYSAEQLALDMGDYTNNSSLVLAFELGKDGKVLLFVADAQRGNWISWSKKSWKDGTATITARDLLSRTVLYKVGHHGRHNATLHGAANDEYANLAWMAEAEHGREFVAMITAVRKWATEKAGWDHPLKGIKDALLLRTAGRVFQTDTDVSKMKMAADGSKADWDDFQSRTKGDTLFFDYTIQM